MPLRSRCASWTHSGDGSFAVISLLPLVDIVESELWRMFPARQRTAFYAG